MRLGPGPQNKGIFVRILRDGPGKGEEYQITHPEAQVSGILKGAYYGTMSDQISVTVRGGEGKTRLRVLLDYKDEVSLKCGEGWLFLSHLKVIVKEWYGAPGPKVPLQARSLVASEEPLPLALSHDGQ